MNEKSLKGFGIYVFNYQTDIASGNYSLSDIVDILKETVFSLENIAKSKKIIFVCHSMGGIIVRKLIVERSADFIERNIQLGLFLVASPSLGSKYANWLGFISTALGNEQAKALKFSQNNLWLNDLDKSFFNLKETSRLSIFGKEILEDKFITKRGLLWKKQIVEPLSGHRYFGESLKIPGSDHFTIAKPNSYGAIQHQLLVKFIKIHFDQTITSQTSQEQATTSISKSKLDISRLAKRLGTYLSTVTSDHLDNVHEYILLERIDLLDYTKGNFHSIRILHIRNVSNAFSSFVPYVECSEKRCTFMDTNIKAFHYYDKVKLKVESIDDERISQFSHAFKIFFPEPLKPGEEFTLIYSITLPNELAELSDNNEIMSIYLGRIIHNVHQLKFSVCLNFAPTSISVECEDINEHGEYYEVPYDGENISKKKINAIFPKSKLYNELGIDWGELSPTCLSIKVTNPEHKLYKIRYMR
ncbi:MAG: hypothetical protein Tsb002_34540 [Wenzhouxiangellaceae bacterium]